MFRVLWETRYSEFRVQGLVTLWVSKSPFIVSLDINEQLTLSVQSQPHCKG
ncbi:unnamed protein product [Staurois parvus]|uniref:Uncharacterized protein n=1 Tax=Staurois parvus TaxID=386267 RepID=A0ABN9C1C0_9NEOB|nr:unnamed protein product [Staurois parvus]